MKTLTITYNGAEIFSAPVEEFQWIDSAGGVTVTGKIKPPAAKSSGPNLLELLSAARRQQAAQKPSQERTSDSDSDTQGEDTP